MKVGQRGCSSLRQNRSRSWIDGTRKPRTAVQRQSDPSTKWGHATRWLLVRTRRRSAAAVPRARGKRDAAACAMANIESAMTPDPECCTADESVIECARLMESADVGMIPVVESRDTRQLIGVVTDRDLCLSVIGRGLNPRECTVEEAMTDEVFTVSPRDTFEKALETMKQHRIRRLPVVDERGSVVGVLSQADLAHAGTAEQVKSTVQTISRET